MTNSPNVKDILNDIEFEIAQGIIAQEELRHAIEAIKQYQNSARAQTFKSLKATSPYRESLSRQYRINDMLTSLLQELALALQSMQNEVEKLRGLPPGILQPVEAEAVTAAPVETPQAPKESLEVKKVEAAGLFDADLEIRPSDEIEYAMQPDTIRVDLQARPFKLPVIGWLLTKLKIFYQRPALFYTTLFSERQAPVNRIFGDRILYLESLVQAQQGQIKALKAQLVSLQGQPLNSDE